MERGISAEWVKEVRSGGGSMESELVKRDREVQAQERIGRILNSRWNKWYREIRTLGLPRYLKEKGKETRMIRVARFRLGNEMREGRY